MSKEEYFKSIKVDKTATFSLADRYADDKGKEITFGGIYDRALEDILKSCERDQFRLGPRHDPIIEIAAIRRIIRELKGDAK